MLDYNSIYWDIAMIASTLSIIRLVIVFIASDIFEDISDDFEFGIIGIINFLLGFSWMAISLQHIFTNQLVIGLSAVIGGIIISVLYIYLLKFISKLEQTNH